MSLLTIKQQLKIVNKVICGLEKQQKSEPTTRKFGLCHYFNKELGRIHDINMYDINIDIAIWDYIPLFTYQNAVEHGNTANHSLSGAFWWNFCTYDYDNRLLFLNWIKQELNKQL